MSYSLDFELAPIAAQMPTLDLSDIAAARVEQRRQRDLRPAPDRAGVEVTETTAPGRPGEPDVTVRVYRPQGPASGAGANGRSASSRAGADGRSASSRAGADGRSASSRAGVLDIHGGGFITGDLETSAAACLQFARELGVVVVSVDYRLAPEHPYPAALRDCEAALRWFAGEAGRLGVDPARIAVHGMSAGAGIATGLALLCRDEAGPPIAFLYLGIPELDDRQSTASMLAFVDTPVWTRTKSGISWDSYLGAGVPGSPHVEAYAAPARAADLAGLPPTYISVATFDPLRDEAIAFGQALLAAGVPVELHLFPGTFHGSSLIDVEVSRREQRERLDVLRRV
jgi:acetyl esterase/lipase